MRLSLLEAAGPVLMALAMALVLTRRKLVRQFTEAAAVSSHRAMALSATNPLTRFWLARLQRSGVLRATSGGRLWLDQPAWDAHRQSRRRRALTVLGAVLVLLLVLFATGRLGSR
jgi:hypothetical protein